MLGDMKLREKSSVFRRCLTISSEGAERASMSTLYHSTMSKVTAMYSSSWKPISELRSVTCHMRSHSVTCHPTQVNAPHLNPSQAGSYLIYLPWRDGRLSWPWSWTVWPAHWPERFTLYAPVRCHTVGSVVREEDRRVYMHGALYRGDQINLIVCIVCLLCFCMYVCMYHAYE